MTSQQELAQIKVEIQQFTETASDMRKKLDKLEVELNL